MACKHGLTLGGLRPSWAVPDCHFTTHPAAPGFFVWPHNLSGPFPFFFVFGRRSTLGNESCLWYRSCVSSKILGSVERSNDRKRTSGHILDQRCVPRRVHGPAPRSSLPILADGPMTPRLRQCTSACSNCPFIRWLTAVTKRTDRSSLFQSGGNLYGKCTYTCTFLGFLLMFLNSWSLAETLKHSAKSRREPRVPSTNKEHLSWNLKLQA